MADTPPGASPATPTSAETPPSEVKRIYMHHDSPNKAMQQGVPEKSSRYSLECVKQLCGATCISENGSRAILPVLYRLARDEAAPMTDIRIHMLCEVLAECLFVHRYHRPLLVSDPVIASRMRLPADCRCDLLPPTLNGDMESWCSDQKLCVQRLADRFLPRDVILQVHRYLHSTSVSECLLVCATSSLPQMSKDLIHRLTVHRMEEAAYLVASFVESEHERIAGADTPPASPPPCKKNKRTRAATEYK